MKIRARFQRSKITAQFLSVDTLEDDTMKICIFGKYPPIQGGVSMRTYWTAHRLAQLGHTVHVVTNAKEVELPYRMFMRDEDWARCDSQYSVGSVQVHWTESYGQYEWHIPSGTSSVTKLASLGFDITTKQAIDLIYSHYVEPYSVVGHMIAHATGLPHVVRTAGSDAGRLWRLPQFGSLYNHIFTSADAIICGPATSRRMIEAGVKPARITLARKEHVNLVELFTPDGPALEVTTLRDQSLNGTNNDFRSSLFGEFDPLLRYFGVYGKLGETKGTYSLLAAFKKMQDRGLRAGLLVMGHESPAAGDAFREYVRANGLERRVCQLPFLPHWRVPEFIRRCVAVCCLEQDFPIKFHDPIVAREVLTCGGCLVGSNEIIQKLPNALKLIDGYNCIVVQDVNRVEDLVQQLVSVLEYPDRVEQIRRRAREYGVEIHKGNTFPRWLESTLSDVASGREPSLKNIDKGQIDTIGVARAAI
jgi:glycosyltransferase involved in cell wall biosynthesis